MSFKKDSSFVYYEKIGQINFASEKCIISDTQETFNSMDIFDRIKSGGGKDTPDQFNWLYLDNIDSNSSWTTYLKINGHDDTRLELIAVNDDYISHDDPNDIALYAWMSAGNILTDIGGVIGIFDLKHFDDDDLIATLYPSPSTHSNILWLKYVNKSIENSLYKCSIIPYGAAIGDLPDRTRLEVETITDLVNNKVIGIKIYLYPFFTSPTLKLKTITEPTPILKLPPFNNAMPHVKLNVSELPPEFLIERIEFHSESSTDQINKTLNHLFNKGTVYVLNNTILKVI